MAHPLDRLRYHVSGAIERGEAVAIVAIPALPSAETIFEIFECRSGRTHATRCGIERTLQTIQRLERAGLVYDYLPAKSEGFYVVDDLDHVSAGPFKVRSNADARQMVANQGSDRRTFRVVEHRLGGDVA